MSAWAYPDSPRLNPIRITPIAGLLITLLPAGLMFIYGPLVEEGYEAANRAKPYEWVIAASFLGPAAAAIAIYGLVVCSRGKVRVGTVAQAVAVVMVCALVDLAR